MTLETLKRTLHNTPARCHENGTRFTPAVFDRQAGGWGLHAQFGQLDLPKFLRLRTWPVRQSTVIPQ